MDKIQDLLPEFMAEIASSLTSMRHSDLASQLSDLELEKWTYDPESEAGYLYLSGQHRLNIVEQNIIGVRYGESIELEDVKGTVIIDTDNFNRLKGIEILSRKDLVDILERICVPNKGTQTEASEPHR
jgi:uncharacterized protein YuzE